MRQFVCKCWAIAIIGLMGSVLVACGNGDGPVSLDDSCIVHADCDDDAPYCYEERCVECRGGGDCADGESCVDNVCVVETTTCTDNSDCPFSSQVCDEGECKFVPRQCTAVGQECELGAPTRSGYSCEDLGRGARCYERCYSYRMCLSGSPSISRECDDGYGCIEDPEVVSEPVCMPGECSDFFDTEAGCAELYKHDPDGLENGAHCIDIGDGALVCAGAGVAQDGEFCEETTDCAAGLTCVNRLPQHAPSLGSPLPTLPGTLGGDSFCAPACNSDNPCDDGRECIGDDDGVFDGVGFCGDRCEPFGTDEERCSDEVACVPVSAEDGVCFRETSRERDYYENCSSSTQCPDSAACLDLFGDGAQCFPLCDPRLETSEERNATCPQPPGADGDRVLGGDCLDLGPNIGIQSVIGTGLCLEACRDADDWGIEGCSGDNRGCSPVGSDTGWCFPSNGLEVGETCHAEGDCQDGAHCDLTGDGTGVCRARCQPGEQTNPNLGCTEEEEVCFPLDGYDNLGECRIPCEPGFDGTDPECPEMQQNCFATGDGMGYCAASGNIQHGEDCGTPLIQDCAPGMVCAKQGRTLNDVLTAPFNDLDDGESAQCVMTCEPFVGQFGSSGCPSGYACSPVTPQGESRSQGHCVPMVDNPRASLQECANSERGYMCGENSFCVNNSTDCGPDRSICLQFCDYTSQTGCTHNTTCEQGFVGGPLLGFLGLCM